MMEVLYFTIDNVFYTKEFAFCFVVQLYTLKVAPKLNEPESTEVLRAQIVELVLIKSNTSGAAF